MAKKPRNHHFIPKFYLAGFTTFGTADAELFVLDQSRRDRWKSTPRGAAYRSHFYKVDLGPDVDPAGIETALGKVEDQCSRVVRGIVETELLPTGEDFVWFLNFVALMAARVPGVREAISGIVDQVLRGLGPSLVRSEEVWAEFEKSLPAGGDEPRPTYAEMKAFVEGGQYTIDYDQTWHVGTMIEVVGELLPWLDAREWSIWIVEDGAPDLICSDRPVSLGWTHPKPPPQPPGFGTRQTMLTMPISRRIAVVSSFEGQAGVKLNAAGVARINSLTGMHANQLYSATPDFAWMMRDGCIGNADDILEALRDRGS